MRPRGPNSSIVSVLAVAVAIGIASPAAAVCGDANGDGNVSVSDGVQALRAAADLASICGTDCDIDGNGAISVTDGVNILRKAAGLAIAEACPDANRVASVIGHTIGIFGPVTKIGAFVDVVPQGSLSPCDNDGSFEESDSGFIFGNCEIDGLTFTGFLAKGDGSLGFSGLSVARRGDVLTLQGTLNVGDAGGGNPELSGVLQGDSQLLGPYSILFQQVVSDDVGQTLDGELVFDTSKADLDDVAEIRVTLTGGTVLPVVIRYADDTTQDFTYDTDADELTPVDGTTPPVARVRLSNIDDRITAFLNLKQVLQAQSTGPNATNDTGFQVVDGLQCGDNLFEFVVENTLPGSGYTFSVELEVGGKIVSSRTCGQAGVQGCDDNNLTQGIVARDVTFVCVPCPGTPCTQGAGTCANPLSIQNRDRLQIHGRTSGPGNFSGGPCGATPGPESVFRFTPPTSGCYEFSTCGTSFDSQLYIGDGLCPGTSGPFPEDCRDDDQPCADGTDRELTFTTLNAGQPITLILEGEGSQGGNYTFDVRPSGRCID